MSSLIFDIKDLLKRNIGGKESYTFEETTKLDEIDLKSSIKGEVELMRIPEGINANISDLSCTVGFKCGKCLEKIKKKIDISSFERQYLLEKPNEVPDPNDLFMVNLKTQEIDIKEPIRQEIILHFPMVPVCSQSCKGICAHCGTNRNKKDCKCKDESIPTGRKPLAALKDLIK